MSRVPPPYPKPKYDECDQWYCPWNHGGNDFCSRWVVMSPIAHSDWCPYRPSDVFVPTDVDEQCVEEETVPGTWDFTHSRACLRGLKACSLGHF